MYLDMGHLVGKTLGQCVREQKVVARGSEFSFLARIIFDEYGSLKDLY